MKGRHPSPRSTRRNCHGSRRPGIEALEGRLLLATITVNTASDENGQADATVSLREAIAISNGTLAVGSLSAQEQAQVSGALSSPNTIAFNIPGAGLHTINALSDLPVITRPVIIDGFTQPGSSPNTNPTTQPINAVPLVEINGTQDVAGGVGLTISAGNSTVRGLVIDGFVGFLNGRVTAAINLLNQGGDTIAGNFLNTDPTGTTQRAGFDGIDLGPGTSDTTIGGMNPADRNLIAGGNSPIIGSSATGTLANVKILGNFVGTDATGTRFLPGGFNAGVGISLSITGTGLVVGGPTLAARNIVAGYGIFLTNQSGAIVQGNDIGVAIDGTTVLQQDETQIQGGQGNLIGGTTPGAGNVMSGLIQLIGSTGNVIQGNFIGTDRTGTVNFGNQGEGVRLNKSDGNTVGGSAAGAGNTIAFNLGGGVNVNGSRNTVSRNSIFGNSSRGISNVAATFTPTLSTVSPTSFSGALSGTPNTAYTLEFFATPVILGLLAQDLQGKTFLFSATVTTDPSGQASFTLNPPAAAASGQYITASATDPTGTTSSLSRGLIVPAGAATSADLGVTLATAPSPVKAGDDLTYTITVNNAGPDPAQGVTLNDVVPSNARFVSLSAPAGWTTTAPAVGGSGTVTATTPTLTSVAPAVFTLVVRVDPAAASGATVVDTATVGSTTPDPNTADNSFTTNTGVITTTGASADLAVSAPSDTPSPVAPGGLLTFDVTLRNLGPSLADNVVGMVQIPAHTTFVSFAAPSGVSVTAPPVGGTGQVIARTAAAPAGLAEHFTLVVRVDQGVPSGTVITNIASVSSATPDPVAGNNTASASSRVSTTTPVPPPPPPTGDGPRVIGVRRYGYHAMPTTLVIAFNQSLDPASAGNVANYRVYDDRGVLTHLDSATYDPATQTVTLRPHSRLNLHRHFQLVVNGSTPGGLRGASGLLLDGGATGRAGSDYRTSLSASNLVVTNPFASGATAALRLAAQVRANDPMASTSLTRKMKKRA